VKIDGMTRHVGNGRFDRKSYDHNVEAAEVEIDIPTKFGQKTPV